MILTAIACSSLLWMPTINRYRCPLDYQAETPYVLGIAQPAIESHNIDVYIGNHLLFHYGDYGTNLNLYTITNNDTVLFYEDGLYKGSIVPEPVTAIMLAMGLALSRMVRNKPFGGKL